MITRKEAKEQGLKHYFIGQSCKRGHVAERLVNCNHCVECLKENGKRFDEANPEYDKNWQKKNAKYLRDYNRKRRYSEPTRPEPDNCECCNIHISKLRTSLHFDHDHETGKFRGWLCDRCNRGLGYFDDSIDIVKLLLKYLQK